MTPAGEIHAVTEWRSNAEMIADAARLGYLQRGWATLDPTYGNGAWWRRWRPDLLVAHDIDPQKSPTGVSVDVTDLPYDDRSFDAVVFDPPYKLNGTPTHDVDEPYGVAGAYTSRTDRHRLIVDGVRECARVLADGFLLVKVQDQVNGGRVRWQTRMVDDALADTGLDLVDMLLMVGGRPQPPGRPQVHARRNYSTLMVYRRRTRAADL